MDEEATEPTEDDLIGKNGAYAQSIAILHNGLNSMSRELSKIQLNAGNGMVVNGEFPSYVVSVPTRSGPKPEEEVNTDTDWPLKPNIGSSIRFTPAQVLTYSASISAPLQPDTPMWPRIGGNFINEEPPPTLPVEEDGAILYLKHTYTWLGTTDSNENNGFNGDILTTDLEIVQFGLGINVPPTRLTSTSYGVDPVADNVTYLMFSSYGPNREILIDPYRNEPDGVRSVGQFILGAVFFDTP